MLLGERTGVWSGSGALPYDREVAWLKSDGGQVIKTGYIPKSNTKILTKFILYGATRTWNSILGRGERYNTQDELTLGFNSSGKHFTLYAGGTANLNSANGTAPYEHVFSAELTIRYFKLVDETIEGTRTYWLNSNQTVLGSGSRDLWFYNGNNGTADLNHDGLQAAFDYFKIYEDTELVMDCIPVVKDGVGFMYDEVSGQLFGNAGTGAFTWSELNAAAGGGGGYKLKCARRSHRRSSRPYARFCATSRRWEVAA